MTDQVVIGILLVRAGRSTLANPSLSRNDPDQMLSYKRPALIQVLST